MVNWFHMCITHALQVSETVQKMFFYGRWQPYRVFDWPEKVKIWSPFTVWLFSINIKLIGLVVTKSRQMVAILDFRLTPFSWNITLYIPNMYWTTQLVKWFSKHTWQPDDHLVFPFITNWTNFNHPAMRILLSEKTRIRLIQCFTSRCKYQNDRLCVLIKKLKMSIEDTDNNQHYFYIWLLITKIPVIIKDLTQPMSVFRNEKVMSGQSKIFSRSWSIERTCIPWLCRFWIVKWFQRKKILRNLR